MKKIQSDKKKRLLYKKNECKYIEYKSMASNHYNSRGGNVDWKEGEYTSCRLVQWTRNSSKVRIRNRCIETGRSRAVFRFCKLSRIKLRQRASEGTLPGVEKSSW